MTTDYTKNCYCTWQIIGCLKYSTDNSWSISLKIQHVSCYIGRLSYVCDTFKTSGKQIFIHLIFVFDNIRVILVQLNQFELMVWGECDTSYAQSMCKVSILSAVYGIGPTVAYTWRSLVNMLNYWYQPSFLPLMYSFVVDLPLKVYVKIFYRDLVNTCLVFHAQTYQPTCRLPQPFRLAGAGCSLPGLKNIKASSLDVSAPRPLKICFLPKVCIYSGRDYVSNLCSLF